jgi:hypothetical protein
VADANTAVIVLACVQGGATLILAGVTLFYAKTTARISDDTRRQADASVKMAREMKEQRLDADRPYLLIETLGLEGIEWHELDTSAGSEPDPHSAYPRYLVCRIHNAGRGPAKELRATLLQPLVAYNEPTKDVLRPGDFWEVSLTASEALGLLHEGFTGEAPLGMEQWMHQNRIQSRAYGDAYDCGIVVGCTDIHDRKWTTYLKFGLISTTDNVRKVVTSRILKTIEHRIVGLDRASDTQNERSPG